MRFAGVEERTNACQGVREGDPNIGGSLLTLNVRRLVALEYIATAQRRLHWIKMNVAHWARK